MSQPGFDPVTGEGADLFLHVKTKRAGKVKGEAVAPGHEEDIIVSAWSWGVEAGSALGSGQATARRAYRHLTIVKIIDAASTSLLSALATNDEVKEAKLSMRKAGEEQIDYFSILLGGARVVGIDVEVDKTGAPRERVQFAFTKVEVEYRRQSAAGLAGGTSVFTDEVLPA